MTGTVHQEKPFKLMLTNAGWVTGSQDLEDDPLNLPSGRSGRVSSGKRSSMGSDDFLNLRLPRLPEQKAKEFKDKLTEEHLRHLSVSSSKLKCRKMHLRLKID